MNPEKQMNLTMLCDYYELTMTNGYYACGMQNRITYFDIFFRSVPDGGAGAGGRYALYALCGQRTIPRRCAAEALL